MGRIRLKDRRGKIFREFNLEESGDMGQCFLGKCGKVPALHHADGRLHTAGLAGKSGLGESGIPAGFSKLKIECHGCVRLCLNGGESAISSYQQLLINC